MVTRVPGCFEDSYSSYLNASVDAAGGWPGSGTKTNFFLIKGVDYRHAAKVKRSKHSTKFSHYLASNSCPINLPDFNDKHSSQSYEMSLFIRMYSKYLSEKTASYRAMAFDFCKVKRGVYMREWKLIDWNILTG
ncbi:unnamed protein product [Calicophoron daubneyi]|uniref:AP180 N-terminal homology (ANTH) domain-containing protein n=1 Tax=Calicophoron daubneyi TaxID=300641 RepID=A0AAV2TDC4_CALDB